MGVLGFGFGGFSAAMPGVILAVTPKSETSSAMSFNYVVRSVGTPVAFVTCVPPRMVCHHGYRHFDDKGCAMTAQRHRRPDPRRGHRPGHLFPDDSAYTTAVLVGIGAMAITTLTSLALARRRSSETNP
ncbi:hypothetical protein [Nonomuraea sp. JJY05]|jgi:hypothetical protein|uniref:hypothetical protein n=1 Tax=Nonomuraea sp. JJY05 TaxID=3350255 RepID=UPI00373ED1CA